MKWLDDFMYGLHVDTKAVAEFEKYRTIREMAVRGFRDLVRKRLRRSHGVDLRVITRSDAPAEVLITLDDAMILHVLQEVNCGDRPSINHAVKSIAKHLWQTWDARFSQRPDLMRKYRKQRGHPASD